ncbi:MAG: hypothetical protein KC646_01570 [Candidatus Cloacimonetes bacterium]|nr:hypothetical protein [Candidatus Cloacimonadota bacterium]
MNTISQDRIKQVIHILQKQVRPTPVFSWSQQINQSIDFLNSSQAKQKVKLDPYWPKWSSTWWHVLSLIEINKVDCIPPNSLIDLHDSIKTNIIDFFPLLEAELTPKIDPYRNIMCHCALGTYIQMCFYTNTIDFIPPWIEQWYLQYQINDGGYNCDDEAYHKSPPKSSLVSTLPMLEALLLIVKNPNNIKDPIALEKVLDNGVHYFLDRNLLGSSSDKNTPIRQDWLELSFPRFYEFDALRVLKFANQWAQYKSIKLPVNKIYMVLDHLCTTVESQGYLKAGVHTSLVDKQSYTQQQDESWKFEPASRFSLLDCIEEQQVSSYFLNLEFLNILSDLQA